MTSLRTRSHLLLVVWSLALGVVACGETGSNTGGDANAPDVATGDLGFQDVFPTTDVKIPDSLGDLVPDVDLGELLPDTTLPDLPDAAVDAEVTPDAPGPDADAVGDTLAEVSPDAVEPDAVADVAPDAAPDTVADVTPDAVPDVVPDVTPDAVPDVVPDVTPDAVPDVVADVTPDAVPDVVADVTPDAVPDVVADVTPDATPDAVPDVTPDAVPDAVADVTPDATPDADTVCVPVCADPVLGVTLECGDDGCGGICGVCGDGATCNAGLCEAEGVVPTTCAEAHGLVGCCADGDVYWFEGGALNGLVGGCAGQGCGWDATNQFYDCGLSGAEPTGAYPIACGGTNPAPETCPVCSCVGMECGDDGCGTSCGACDSPEICGTSGQCVDPETLQCVVKPECTEADPCDCAACVDDGACTLDDDCVCPECASDSFCGDISNCNNDGICDLFNESCACDDCAPHPFCCAPGVCESSATFSGGACERVYSDLGTPCDDGDATTTADACDGAGACAGVTSGDAQPKLVINELDYDMAGTDTTEFLEIYNPGPGAATLARWKLQHVNGSSGAVLWTRALSEGGATLAAGAYMVFGSPTVIASLPVGVQSVDIGTVAFENGAPDGVRLMLDNAFASGLSYEGTMAGTGEGTGAPSDAAADSLQRCPNGVDTHDNGVDFVLRPPSPGVANPCGAAACTPEPGFVPKTCDEAHGLVGCCAGGTVYWFELGMLQPIAGSSCSAGEGCGWDAAQGFYACGNSGVADPSGTYPITCGCENPSPETCP
ncbi:MAG: lamin tail domain-containing protein [Myxococcota bacterium]